MVDAVRGGLLPAASGDRLTTQPHGTIRTWNITGSRA